MADNDTVSLADVREVLKDHFPEYVSGYCLCGQPITTYMEWTDHVIRFMEPDTLMFKHDVPQENSDSAPASDESNMP